MTGDEIKAFRKSKNLTQEGLGEIVGVGKSSVANWENDHTSPSGSSLKTLEKLMSGEWAIVPLSSQEEELLDQGVERGGFKNREDYLLAGLTHLIRHHSFDLPTPAQESPRDQAAS